MFPVASPVSQRADESGDNLLSRDAHGLDEDAVEHGQGDRRPFSGQPREAEQVSQGGLLPAVEWSDPHPAHGAPGRQPTVDCLP
jgi:hypothetical protein